MHRSLDCFLFASCSKQLFSLGTRHFFEHGDTGANRAARTSDVVGRHLVSDVEGQMASPLIPVHELFLNCLQLTTLKFFTCLGVCVRVRWRGGPTECVLILCRFLHVLVRWQLDTHTVTMHPPSDTAKKGCRAECYVYHGDPWKMQHHM